MELRHLRAFVAVASTEHFGRAATMMRITQPALTQRIQAIESELRLQLLTRSAREVRLTTAGKALLPYAKRVIQIEDQALADLAAIAGGRSGRLRIAYLLHGNVVLQGRVVAYFRGRYPDVELETRAAHSRTNLEDLCNGDVDVSFIELPANIPAGISLQSIGSHQQLMLALPVDHKLAVLDTVPVEALRGVPLILSPASENPAMTAALSRWLTRLTTGDLKVVAEEPADQALEAVAVSGSMAAVVSSWRALAGATRVVFKALSPAPLVEFAVAYRTDDPNPLLKHLLMKMNEISASTKGGADTDGELLSDL